MCLNSSCVDQCSLFIENASKQSQLQTLELKLEIYKINQKNEGKPSQSGFGNKIEQKVGRIMRGMALLLVLNSKDLKAKEFFMGMVFVLATLTTA